MASSYGGLLFLLIHFMGTSIAVELFPYGPLHHDQVIAPNDDGSSGVIKLAIPFPFFNKLHQKLWVDNNGAISFLSEIRKFTPQCSAVSDYERMVAPFWADVDTRYFGGKVYFRTTFEASVMSQAVHVIGRAFPKYQTMTFRFALIATWDNVTFYGANLCSHPDVPRNTFQAIIVTDGIHSFAIFLFKYITWTTGTASHGEACSGLGGTPAKVGFDMGDGKNLYMLPESCTSEVVKISTKSNFDSPGSFVFRIDNEEIITAKCNTTRFLTESLEVAPVFMNIFGHVPVVFSGPCFNESSSITCRFHDPIKGFINVPGSVLIKEDRVGTAVCMAPYIYGTGRILVQVIEKYKDGHENEYHGMIYVTSPERTELKVNVTGPTSDAKLEGSWQPNIFPNGTEHLQLDLHYYDKRSSSWKHQATLEFGLPNNGHFSLSVSHYSSLKSEFVVDKMLSFSLSPKRASNKQSLGFGITDIQHYSGLMFASWTQLIKTGMCQVWSANDPGTDGQNLPPCPPNSGQATRDPRFEPDPACSKPPCFFHPGVSNCIRSAGPVHGGGQQCCYTSDGNLKLGPPGGGTEDRSYYRGSLWPTRIPYLDHFLDDVLPWFLCCYKMPQEICRETYYKKRKSRDSSGYKPQPPVGGQGDPHIMTFDQLRYTFNGYGEYWLGRSKGANEQWVFKTQARMLPSSGWTATVFTAFAMQYDKGPIVQVQKSAVRKVDILVDGTRVDISQPELRDLSYTGVNVQVADDYSKVKVNFYPHQINLVIEISSEALNIYGTLDPWFLKNTEGLFGVYDGDKKNDFTQPNGTKISIDSSMRDIHFKFGETWRIKEADSLFTYGKSESYASFNKPKFLPDFHHPDPSEFPTDIRQLCSDDLSCLYDYQVTKSREFANRTLSAVKQVEKLVEDSNKPPIDWSLCPTPELKHGAANVTSNPLNNSAVSFLCFTDYALADKEATLICRCPGQKNCQWEGKHPLCLWNESVRMQGSGILMAVLILILISFNSHG